MNVVLLGASAAPDDARAWAGLARASASQAAQGLVNVIDGYRSGREAVAKALALDDSLPEVYENLRFLLTAFECRWAEADEAFRKPRALAPGNGRILATSATFEAIMGRMDEALRLSEWALELDPLSATIHLFRARALMWARHDDEAGVSDARALEPCPGMTTAHAPMGNLLIAQARVAAAIAELARKSSPGYRNWSWRWRITPSATPGASDDALASAA